ncbi:U-box domain-containing protein 9-like [Henckelia pumila]|uniref:U-box domain-containing protein 9-like n=1 Tax=Henckelia pumila TaxID=405737 RepID=UPI003C6E1530
MANNGVSEGDSDMAAKAMELKTELQKLVKAIVDADDVDFEATGRALQMLHELKELRLKKSMSLKLRSGGNNNNQETAPEEFRCPLSKELMRDPVIVANGQTYDRPFIQKWLKSGNRTCPRTQQVLTHTILTPNQLIRHMIVQWCKNREITLSESLQHSSEEGLMEADRDHFLSLLGKMSSTLQNQKEAAKELRQLTKKIPSFRALFGESVNAIPQLLSPLFQSKCLSEVHPSLQEDIITTLLNLSIHDNNKKLVAETPEVIPLLMDALRSGTIETRSNAAATLFTLSAVDSNKSIIGESGALKPLVDLLDEGHPLAMKDAATAIFNLCIIHDNKDRAVGDGAVRVIFKKIASRIHVDELLSILAMLSTNQKAVEEMGELGGVSCLLSLMRETSLDRIKENCVAILYSICFSDRSKLSEMREEENTYGTLSQLTQDGTTRAKRKAAGILERLNRPLILTHTA